jgi:hypothetical protein
MAVWMKKVVVGRKHTGNANGEWFLNLPYFSKKRGN